MGAVGKLVQKGIHLALDGVPVIGKAMKVKAALRQPAPELLDRVEPRGISRQTEQMNRQVIIPGLGTGL